MIENWDSYFCRVEDRPALILLDLSLAPDAPASAYPVCAYIRVTLAAPDEDGLASPEESLRIGDLEDALSARLVADKSALYAGRCISAGYADFYWYTKEDTDWEAFLAKHMPPFGWEWEAGRERDPDWSVYLEFLFPGPYEMLHIQNKRILRHLEELGDDLGEARFIEHLAGFAAFAPAAAFAKALGSMDFNADAPEEEKQEDGGAPFWRVRFLRPDVPDELDAITCSLFDLASEYGGEYYGCAVPARNFADTEAEEEA